MPVITLKNNETKRGLEDQEQRAKGSKKQSIHDPNPINTPASFKLIVDSNCFISYEKPIYISGFPFIERNSSTEAKIETRIGTPTYRIEGNRGYNEIEL